nr:MULTISPECIES: DivIVA domain-containing protein [Paenibacillus]
MTPLEIHNKEFSTVLRGYHQDEVNMFLDQIIRDYEMIEKIIRDLQKQLQKELPLTQNNLDGILQRLREVEIYCWGQPKG